MLIGAVAVLLSVPLRSTAEDPLVPINALRCLKVPFPDVD